MRILPNIDFFPFYTLVECTTIVDFLWKQKCVSVFFCIRIPSHAPRPSCSLWKMLAMSCLHLVVKAISQCLSSNFAQYSNSSLTTWCLYPSYKAMVEPQAQLGWAGENRSLTPGYSFPASTSWFYHVPLVHRFLCLPFPVLLQQPCSKHGPTLRILSALMLTLHK